MLEKFFLEVLSNNDRLNSHLPKNGFSFPLPSIGITGAIGIKDKETIVMIQNKQYLSTSDAIFLPYVKNNINLCFQSDKDVLSAPFSGCHMVRFKYGKGCILEKKQNGGSNNCPHKQLGCSIACCRMFVGHIAYEDSNEGTTCKKLWEDEIKPYCTEVIDFDPFSYEAQAWINNNRSARVHGLITKSGKKFSIGIDYDDKIVFVMEY